MRLNATVKEKIQEALTGFVGLLKSSEVQNERHHKQKPVYKLV